MSLDGRAGEQKGADSDGPGVDVGGAAAARRGLARRDLLRIVPAVGVTGLAGCSGVNEFLGGANEEPTPTFGYGGTPTDGEPTETGAGGSTRTPTVHPGTPTRTGTSTRTGSSTGPRTPTPTTTPVSEYGVQGYGQYGYGGTR